jgi:hypothetical protein
MLRFLDGFEVDRNENSLGVRLTADEIAVRIAQEQASHSRVAASADVIARVEASISAGKPVFVADLDQALAGRSVSERMIAKTDLRRRGLLVDPS